MEYFKVFLLLLLLSACTTLYDTKTSQRTPSVANSEIEIFITVPKMVLKTKDTDAKIEEIRNLASLIQLRFSNYYNEFDSCELDEFNFRPTDSKRTGVQRLAQKTILHGAILGKATCTNPKNHFYGYLIEDVTSENGFSLHSYNHANGFITPDYFDDASIAGSK